MTGDGGCWNRRPAGCRQKDIVAPDHVGIDEQAQPTGCCYNADEGGFQVAKSQKVEILTLLTSSDALISFHLRFDGVQFVY